MIYEVYISQKLRPEIIMTPTGEPYICENGKALLDLISTFYMDGNQEITRNEPQYHGYAINIHIYPQFKRMGLAMNKKTCQIRRIHDVGVHRLTLCNTDHKGKAEYQENGYILADYKEVNKEDWIPVDEEDISYNVYYPNSSIGKDPNFDRLEYQGYMTL